MAVAGDEVWVGDKTGKIHVHCAKTFAEKQVIEKHSKAVTCMAVSADHSKVASGDAYRYIQVWDANSKAEVASIGTHKDRILVVCFSHSGEQLLSTTFDMAYGVTDLSTKEMK